MSDLQKVMERAMKDHQYAETLKTDPATALKQAGVESTPERVQALKSSVDSLRKAKQVFDAKPD